MLRVNSQLVAIGTCRLQCSGRCEKLYLTPLLPYTSCDFTPRSFPAQQTDQGAKCSPAYQTTRLGPGDSQSDFITAWNLTPPSKRMADIYVLWLLGCSWAITLLINQRLSLPPASCLHPLASRFPPRWQTVGGGSGCRSVVATTTGCEGSIAHSSRGCGGWSDAPIFV